MRSISRKLRAEDADIDLRIAKSSYEWSRSTPLKIGLEGSVYFQLLDLLNIFVFDAFDVHNDGEADLFLRISSKIYIKIAVQKENGTKILCNCTIPRRKRSEYY